MMLSSKEIMDGLKHKKGMDDFIKMIKDHSDHPETVNETTVKYHFKKVFKSHKSYTKMLKNLADNTEAQKKEAAKQEAKKNREDVNEISELLEPNDAKNVEVLEENENIEEEIANLQEEIANHQEKIKESQTLQKKYESEVEEIKTSVAKINEQLNQMKGLLDEKYSRYEEAKALEASEEKSVHACTEKLQELKERVAINVYVHKDYKIEAEKLGATVYLNFDGWEKVFNKLMYFDFVEDLTVAEMKAISRLYIFVQSEKNSYILFDSEELEKKFSELTSKI